MRAPLPVRLQEARRRAPGRLACVLLALCLGPVAASGALHSDTLRRSDSFLVHDIRPAYRDRFTPESQQANVVELDPGVLIISAERIRQALAQELGFSTPRSSRMALVLHGKQRGGEHISIISTLLPQGWQLQAYIPDQISRIQLIRGMVQLNLQEVANRNGGARAAQVPAWLVEGLAVHLLEASGPELVVSAVPSGVMARNIRNIRPADTLRETREFFRRTRPLTFGELSQPTASLLDREVEWFQRSAHLFVHELLKTREGQAGLMRTVQQLSQHWNWETAFLRGFHPQFTTMLDVEKWWTVTTVSLGQRDPAMLWARNATLDKLDQIRRVIAQVRISTDALPQRTESTLQQMIADWPYVQQRAALHEKQLQLAGLRIESHAELIPLVEAYYLCLHGYVQRREAAASAAANPKRGGPVQMAQVVQETVRQLDDLDRQLATVRAAQISANTWAGQ